MRSIHILHGVEVDIMKDGSLDFDDSVLEQFDIVLASLHDHGEQHATQLTERYMSAIAHPLVNVITHPANRSPALSGGYDVDFDRLFEAAVATGTAMEIDGAPGHLDMDGLLARRAVAAGVTVAIDSDCHRADALGRQMRFGIGTARRGWVEPKHVLNTRGVDAIREFVAAKRARH
jgi:DNA polymerase (family 10)